MARRKYRNKRSKRSNPSFSLRGGLSNITSGFKPSSLMNALPIAGGVVVGQLVRRQIGSFLPAVSSGLPSYAAGLAGAGLMLIIPKYGRQLFAGAVLGEVLRFGNSMLPASMQIPGLSGAGDFLQDFLQGSDEDYTGLSDWYGEGDTNQFDSMESGGEDVNF